jgi:hypothetical protein
MQYADHVNCQKESVSIKSSGNILVDVENSFGNYHIRTQLLTYDVTAIYGKYFFEFRAFPFSSAYI